jgi:hypothetical protein
MVPRTWGKLRQNKGTRNRKFLGRRETTVTSGEYAFDFVTSFLEMSALLGGEDASPVSAHYSHSALQRNCQKAAQNLQAFLFLPLFPSRNSQLK